MVVVAASNIFLFIFAIITVYGATLDPPIGDGVNVLLSNDPEPVAVQMGTHVMLRTVDGRSGYVELILTNGLLEVEMDVLSCMGISEFCYNSTDKMGHFNNICSHQNSCAFKVEGVKKYTKPGEEDNSFYMGDSNIMNRKYVKSCKSKIIRMQYWETVFCLTEKDRLYNSYSCAPKMDSQNKIHIDVRRIDSNCWIKIANAQIYRPPPPTTPMITTPTEPPTTEPPPEPTTETPVYELWYFWLGIAVIVLIIIVGGVIIYLIWKEKLCFEKNKKKPLPTRSYPSALPPPPPPARHQPSPIEIVTSVPKEASSQKPAKNEKSKKHGKAIEESLSVQQPTPIPAALSTPAAKKRSQKPKEKDTVADKISKPKDKKSKPPRALKYTNPPPATSESESNRDDHQRPPQKPYPKYPGDKRYLPSRHGYAKNPPKFDDTTKPPAKIHVAPPTVTSITESNQNTITEQQSKTTDASKKVQTGDSKMNSVASIK